MDWQTVLTIAGIILFVVVMMRECGGMMGGGVARVFFSDLLDARYADAQNV